MIKEKNMVTKRGGESTTDICMLAFRKTYSPITEKAFKPDRELAVEMVERKIRVQDLLELLCETQIIPSKIDALIGWYKMRKRNPICPDCQSHYENPSGQRERCPDCATDRQRQQAKEWRERHPECR